MGALNWSTYNLNQNRSPFTRGKASMNRSYELSADSDISFVSSGRPSIDRMFPSFYDITESGTTPRHSNSSEYDLKSFASSLSGAKSLDMSTSPLDFSSNSGDSSKSWSSQNMVRKIFLRKGSTCCSSVPFHT